MGSTGSRPAAEQPTAPPDAPSTDEFEVVDGASAASESKSENSSSIHAEGPLIRGLGHAAASLKVGTVAAIVALLTVPDEYQPMLRLAEASYSNTLGFGASLDRMPLAAVAALERRWLSDGDGDFRLLGPTAR